MKENMCVCLSGCLSLYMSVCDSQDTSEYKDESLKFWQQF
jgi:hypothetical protein